MVKDQHMNAWWYGTITEGPEPRIGGTGWIVVGVHFLTLQLGTYICSEDLMILLPDGNDILKEML